jgi:hypothetical protein
MDAEKKTPRALGEDHSHAKLRSVDGQDLLHAILVFIGQKGFVKRE